MTSEKNFDDLISALKDPDSSKRIWAVRDLWKLQDKRVLEPLLEGLKDDDALVVNEIILTLSALEDKKIVNPVINLLKTLDAKKEKWGDIHINNIKVNIITLLAEMGEPAAIPVLLDLLRNDDAQIKRGVTIRGAAAFALGYISSPDNEEVFSNLVELLSTDNIYTKSRVVTGLGYLANPKALKYIKDLHSKEEWKKEVKLQIALGETLIRLGEISNGVDSLINTFPSARKPHKLTLLRILEELAKDRVLGEALEDDTKSFNDKDEFISDKLLNFLILLVKDCDDVELCFQSVTTLGQLGDIRAIDVLSDVIRGTDKAFLPEDIADLRINAVKALGNIRSKEGLDILENIIKNDDPAESRKYNSHLLWRQEFNRYNDYTVLTIKQAALEAIKQIKTKEPKTK